MPTRPPAFRPSSPTAVNEAHLNPSVCTGVEECQKVVRKLAAAGVDVIKVMATGGVLDPGAMGLEQHFTDAELKGIVDMAHAMHLKTAAHAHGARGILAATNAGIDSIEHGTFLDEAGARGDEGAWHLLFGDLDGVQRRERAARYRQADAGDGGEDTARRLASGAKASTLPTAPA